MTDLVFTIPDGSGDDGTIVLPGIVADETADGEGLSFIEAILLANAFGGTNTIGTTLSNPQLFVNTAPIAIGDAIPLDLTLNAGVDGQSINSDFLDLFELGSDNTTFTTVGVNLNLNTFSNSRSDGTVVSVSGENVTFSNGGTITASGFSDTNISDQSTGIVFSGDNFTLINTSDGVIRSEGRQAVELALGAFGDPRAANTTIENAGLIESNDDAIRLGSGTITNSGTIQSLGDFAFGDLAPGTISDGISAVFGVFESGFEVPDDGLIVINNLEGGLIDGPRSAILTGGSTTINNDGTLSALQHAVLVGAVPTISGTADPLGPDLAFVLNNSGTITSEGQSFVQSGFMPGDAPTFSDDSIAAVALFTRGASEIENSGLIQSDGSGISAAAGVNLTNTATGQIIADADNSAGDEVAFRSSELGDFELSYFLSSSFSTFSVPEETISIEGEISAFGEGITLTETGEFFGFGTSGAVQNTISIFRSSNFDGPPILPLIDVAATQTSNRVIFLTDPATGDVIFPDGISFEIDDIGTVTARVADDGEIEVVDAAGTPVSIPAAGVDFADTILNDGLIDGDVITGLGDDVVTNNGTIDGDIDLGSGDDVFVNNSADAATVSGGSGSDALSGGQGADLLSGGSGNDFISGGDEGAVSADGSFVFRVFQATLDRAPDLGGFEFFSGALEAGTFTRAQVINIFVNSAEFQNTFGSLDDGDFVELLFNNVLDRPSDAGGFDFFTGQLENGASRASVVTTFIASPEFVANTEPLIAAFSSSVVNGSVESDVFNIFQAALGRQTDAGGLAFFAQNLQSGTFSFDQVLNIIISSAEFQQNFAPLSNTEFVESLFQNALGRAADAGGLAFFVGQLDNGTSRASIITDFINSPEFATISVDDLDAFLTSISNNLSDVLEGGSGDDDLIGGIGGDTFVFDAADGGQDRVLDFAVNGGDVVELVSAPVTDFGALIALGAQDGADTVFDFGGGNTLTLTNVDLETLDADDFAFATGIGSGTGSGITGSAVTQSVVLPDEAFDFAEADTGGNTQASISEPATDIFADQIPTDPLIETDEGFFF